MGDQIPNSVGNLSEVYYLCVLEIFNFFNIFFFPNQKIYKFFFVEGYKAVITLVARFQILLET